MRLIDADKLRETMYHEAFETDTDMQKWDSGCWIRYKMFENAIENAPTIEAEPVKHGRWINGKCSECGCDEVITKIYRDDEVVWTASYKDNYCPNCGALMNRMNEGETE